MLGPGDILDYIRGIQIVISGYQGYAKEKKSESDILVRRELSRTAQRARNHIQNVHDDLVKKDDFENSRLVKSCMSEIDLLMEDVDKGGVGVTHGFTSGVRSMTQRDMNLLIKHDHDVIIMVTEAVRLSNDAEHKYSESGLVSALPIISSCKQKITSCRGFFSERSVFLSSLRKRK